MLNIKISSALLAMACGVVACGPVEDPAPASQMQEDAASDMQAQKPRDMAIAPDLSIGAEDMGSGEDLVPAQDMGAQRDSDEMDAARDQDDLVEDMAADLDAFEDATPDLRDEDMQEPPDAATDLDGGGADMDDFSPDMEASDASMDAGLDMSDLPDMASGSDMGPLMCAAGTPTCFFNDDCLDASTRCEGDSSGNACCVTGPRGMEPAGESCVSGNECESSLCVGDGTGGPMYCSSSCVSMQDCPATLPRCNVVFGICIPAQ